MAGKIIDEDVLKLTVQNLTQLIADHVFEEEEYTPEEVESFFDCTPEQLQFYESIINPDIVSETRLWASKTISDKLQEAITQANEYSDSLIKDISSIQLEWCDTSLPTIGESNKIYILPTIVESNTVNTLNIWNTKTSAYVSIGNLDISLDGYVKTQDMNTALDTKANDNEVLKLDNVLTTTGVETNDNVYSAQLTKTELDKKANDDEVVKKTDIATSISSTSTNDKVAGAKAVHDSLANKLDKTIILTTADEVNSFDKEYQSFIIEPSVAEAVGLPKAPDSTWFCINLSHVKDFKYPSQIAFEYAGIERIMYRTAHNGVWHNWRKLCITSVNDVPVTQINFINGVSNPSNNYYVVKNGICFIHFNNGTYSLGENVDGLELANGLPKPAAGQCSHTYIPWAAGDVKKQVILFVNSNGQLMLHAGVSVNGCPLFTNFSYPVKEE